MGSGRAGGRVEGERGRRTGKEGKGCKGPEGASGRMYPEDVGEGSSTTLVRMNPCVLSA